MFKRFLSVAPFLFLEQLENIMLDLSTKIPRETKLDHVAGGMRICLLI